MELQPIHPAPKFFLWRYVFSTDHKVIAKQYLFAGLVFLLLGGLLAMAIRWQWAYPGEDVPLLGRPLTPASYNSVFTMHGLIMIFFAVTPILISAFGNYLIPLMIGARDMAFPRLNMWSFWVFLLSQVLMLLSSVTQLGAASSGWTLYPPLSSNVGTPGLGQTLVVAAVFVTGVSTIMGAINFITTIIRLRAPGMDYFKLPATVWGLFLTSILNLVFVPVLGAAGVLLLLDRLLGTQFFVASGAMSGPGDPLLFQHLFWIFGHPEVYILILPAWGFLTDMMSFFSRRPAFWYRGSVWAMIGITALSGIVYGHHMYVSGLNPLLGKTFMVLTLLISFPAEILFLNWLQTLWRGSLRLTTPMLFALGTIFVFGLGGLTGIYLATISTDLYLHDTMFVVGHFHMTMAAASFLAALAAIYFWFPKMFGRQMSEALGKLHFALSVPLITAVFTGQMIAGFAGQSRRLFDPYVYVTFKHLLPINQWTSYLAFALLGAQAIFVVNFFYGIFFGKRAPANPWEVGTLEWSVPSPPPYHNFDSVPTVSWGPHELSNPEVKRRLGRDWIGQHEAPVDAATEKAAE